MNPNSSPSEPSGRPTRRQVILGSLGAAVVVGAGIPTVVSLTKSTPPPMAAGPSAGASTAPTGETTGAADGMLVKPLLAAHPFYAAHRGGSRDWPEMSRLGYHNSVAGHVNALEMSLGRTSDGVWFGLHDTTLDRTSGTTGFVAAEHTWAEVQQHKISAKLSINHNQPDQPYYRFDELVTSFGATHTIFVDPKATDSSHHAELLALMARLAPQPANTFIAKGYCTGVRWAAAASAVGLKTWGFYYGSDLDTKPGLLARTAVAWDLVGLDYAASDANWATMSALGKPIIGHIIPSRAAADRALAKGAQGLMISGVNEVLG